MVREIITFASCLKDRIKGADEQPNEEKQRARPEHRSICPHGVVVYHPPKVDVFTGLGAP